jgi:glycosyltransferase involved in cell wall biosynthesis
MLAGYWAGSPCLEQHARGFLAPLWARFAQPVEVPLEPARVRWLPGVPILRRGLEAVLPGSLAPLAGLIASRLFDRWVARDLHRARVDAVIAPELSALTIFRRARQAGITTLLDAAAMHHQTQDRARRFVEPEGVHRRITAIKNREIELADRVLTVSGLAARTYRRAGVPEEKVHSLPLGVDTDLFRPSATATAKQPPGAVFVFCGAFAFHKGFDLLLDAFERFRDAAPGTQLHLIGQSGDAAERLKDIPANGILVRPRLSQPALAAELAAADCLVLPSRSDSFGLVVAEGLACGLPVVVSEMVGARELVREGENGWVVPAGDAAALAKRMLWCAQHREAMARMRPACRRAALTVTWPAYHRRVASYVRSALGGDDPAARPK